MAWNEPGGNNNDPWKNRGGRDQGPPDLDEVFKKFFDKLGFGGGKKPSGKGFGGIGAGLIAGILVVIWFISGFYTVKEAERGVVLRFGEFSHFVEPGLRWKPTFVDSVETVNVRSIRTMPSSGFMLTEDENVVRVDMEIQYRVIEPFKYTFAVDDPDGSLRHALDSAIRYVVGHSRMDDVLTRGREQTRQRVFEELTGIVTPYDMGIDVLEVNFKDARPPEEVKASFDDAIAAQEDEQRFIREAEAYAREIEPTARGRVNRMGQEAEAYKQQVILKARGEVARFEELLPQYAAAPQVTRQRLYLEALEEIYSKTSKVMVDTDGTGNMMYLPLDKILERQGVSGGLPLVPSNALEGVRGTTQSNQSGNSSQNSGRTSSRFSDGRN
ncbi:FtsH protease activity modulator HflK [Lacimicrobium alkaliphilum]|uniref:Protein HflK n=1 Tax=Lacimicrobium alkaliphilum TaxID=1526571 RepID=A0ABQ1RQT7_9ALTE|nr:FtsH protease activity modulator HflK [Lacimicrobium alkaliphilum]GGD76316.1 protease modulator HflK [Lacimicrobium alkaliphilum]